MGGKGLEVEVGKVEGMAVDATEEAVVEGGRHGVGWVVGEVEREVGKGVGGRLQSSPHSPSSTICNNCWLRTGFSIAQLAA